MGQIGWTQQQQEHINSRIQEAVSVVFTQHHTFQNQVADDLRRFGERLDELSHRVASGAAVSGTHTALSSVTAGSLGEQLAVLNGRIDGLYSKVGGGCKPGAPCEGPRL
jgi:hypothetical protein